MTTESTPIETTALDPHHIDAGTYCVLEVLPEFRQGRARYWAQGGRGYTDDIALAGLWMPRDLPPSDRAIPVPALVELEREHGDAVKRLRNLRESMNTCLSGMAIVPDFTTTVPGSRDGVRPRLHLLGPESRDKGARWLAKRLGLELGFTAPGWFPQHDAWVLEAGGRRAKFAIGADHWDNGRAYFSMDGPNIPSALRLIGNESDRDRTRKAAAALGHVMRWAWARQ